LGLRFAIDRHLIEQMALCAEKGRPIDFKPVEEALATMKELGERFAQRKGGAFISAEEGSDFLAKDLCFHEALARCVGYEEALPIIRPLTVTIRLFAPTPLDQPNVAAAIIDEHTNILKCAKAQQWAAAIEAVREHYVRSMARFFQPEEAFYRLKKQNPPGKFATFHRGGPHRH
jgi:DNA-binding GntR family transcriptional regulator